VRKIVKLDGSGSHNGQCCISGIRKERAKNCGAELRERKPFSRPIRRMIYASCAVSAWGLFDSLSAMSGVSSAPLKKRKKTAYDDQYPSASSGFLVSLSAEYRQSVINGSVSSQSSLLGPSPSSKS